MVLLVAQAGLELTVSPGWPQIHVNLPFVAASLALLLLACITIYLKFGSSSTKTHRLSNCTKYSISRSFSEVKINQSISQSILYQTKKKPNCDADILENRIPPHFNYLT